MSALLTEADFTEALRTRVLATALRILRDREDSEDATQRALLLAWRSRGQFRGDSGIGTWLDAITRNTCRMLIRERRGIQFCELPAQLADRDEIGRVRKSEQVSLVHEAITRLPCKQQIVMQGYLAGRALPITSTVKVQRFRTIQILKQRLVAQ